MKSDVIQIGDPDEERGSSSSALHWTTSENTRDRKNIGAPAA